MPTKDAVLDEDEVTDLTSALSDEMSNGFGASYVVDDEQDVVYLV